ncbi:MULTISPECIES: hypothetical protein [Streptomyces]|uniref:hypothetical protein n=1 Tax=Streptomyces TaxID=1883 RepID=UPI000C6C8D70|nr:hypothetical protein [Streptomyces barkulensis]
MQGQHRPSCAKRWREHATTEQWSVERTVDAIHGCCGVSRLRAHRLARGWTLGTAVAEFHRMCSESGVTSPPKVDEDQLALWEKRPDRRPRAATVDLLCRLYRTDSQGIGLVGDYRDSSRLEAPTPRSPSGYVQENSVMGPSSAARSEGGTITDLPADPIERMAGSVRRSVDRTLASTSVSAGQLDLLDERLLWLRTQYISTPPEAMLGVLLADLEEVRTLAAERQPAAAQVRLSETIALLATLVADCLMKLGRLRQSRAWYATARTAADDSGNVEIRARVRAQAAMLPYYYGPLESAISLAREARLLLRHRFSATGAFAAAAEARALARQGDAPGAEEALRHTHNVFEKCGHGSAEDAFAFPERRLLLYLSGVHTFLGRSRQAREVQQRALSLYPSHSGIDPALLRLEQAICLARERNLTEACRLAGAAYLQASPAHRTTILGARVRHVIEALPPSMRSARAVRELGEILALPPGTV